MPLRPGAEIDGMSDQGYGRDAPTHPVVLVRGLRERVRGRELFADVDLVVGRGDVHGVVGPAGAGKTTLMDIIQGVRRPDAGVVELLGVPVLPRDRHRAARVGIQAQQTAFFPRATAWEHLLTMAAVFGASAARAEQVRDAFGLARARDVRVEDLSAGHRRRLAVASAMLHRPEVLFLDEPGDGLDAAARHDLVSLFASVREEETTVVYATRHPRDAERLCDVVSILDRGRIVATAPPAQLVAGLGAADFSGALTQLTGKAYQE